MAQAEKTLNKMKKNPLDWRIEDIDLVARYYGFKRIEAKGSHTKFYHDDLPEILTVPVKRPIKPIYVKMLIALIARLEE